MSTGAELLGQIILQKRNSKTIWRFNEGEPL